jgi:large subunit ribosomal protein L22
MEVTAKLNNLRIAPRKVRLVANLIKGMDAQNARGQLKFLVKKSSEPVGKLLDSAIANAKNNFSLNENNLYISKITVDEGQTLKRWLPRAFGKASPLMKRTSHITIVLSEKNPTIAKNKSQKDKKQVKEGKRGAEETVEKLAKEGEEKNIKIKEIKRPRGASTTSKKKIFNRQSGKKMFQRKSI